MLYPKLSESSDAEHFALGVRMLLYLASGARAGDVAAAVCMPNPPDRVVAAPPLHSAFVFSEIAVAFQWFTLWFLVVSSH